MRGPKVGVGARARRPGVGTTRGRCPAVRGRLRVRIRPQRAHQPQSTGRRRRRRQDPAARAERKRGRRAGGRSRRGDRRSGCQASTARARTRGAAPGTGTRRPRLASTTRARTRGGAPGALTPPGAGSRASARRREAGGTADPAARSTSDSAARPEAAPGLCQPVRRVSTPVGPAPSSPSPTRPRIEAEARAREGPAGGAASGLPAAAPHFLSQPCCVTLTCLSALGPGSGNRADCCSPHPSRRRVPAAAASVPPV